MNAVLALEPIAILYQNSKVKNQKSEPLCVNDQMENPIDK